MKYFGTDGIRGKVNETITFELAYKLGSSLKCLNCDTVVIGTDTRESKDMLSKAVALGAISTGIKVILAGVVPTPALIHYSKVNKILGVMITASHNPYQDNGLKVLNCGVKLSEDEELLVEENIDFDNKVELKELSLEENSNVEELYLNFLNTFEFKSNLKVAIDCANGASYKTAPYIFNKLTSNLSVTAVTPNGVNINENVGSTHISNLINFMKETKSNVGFSFDGDADRVLAVEDGKIIDGDQIIFIIAKYLKDNNKLNKNTVVLTKMSNLGILNRLTELDIKYTLTDVGDKYVVRELMEHNLSIGGENSGHIIMPDILSTGDGVLVAVTLLKIMNETNKTLHQLLDGITMYADKMINLKVEDKSIIKSEKVLNKIKEIENKLGNEGKVIVRASGTENLIRVSVMAKTEQLVEENIEQLVSIIKG